MPAENRTRYLSRYLSETPEEKRDEGAIAYLAALDVVSKESPRVAAAIVQELRDQRSFLKLIASENYCSMAVQLAMGNWLTDKYAEGVAHRRFYAGCENVDAIEEEADSQARKLFAADHSYSQPHSGADANLIAFFAILHQKIQLPALEKLGKKGPDALSFEEHESLRQALVNQRMLGMSLNSGGHLTHGYRLNASSKLLQAHTYEIDPATGLLDYAAIAQQARQVKPLILLAGYSAYPRRIDFAKMREIADSVGAVLLVDMAHFAGLVAGKVFTGDENPIPFAHVVTTTTHKTLRGPRGGLILCAGEYADSIDKGCPMVMGGPLPHVMAAKAIAFKEANEPSFRTYAANIVENAQALAKQLSAQGLRVLTGGTDNHLVLFDVSPLGLTGRQAETALRQAHMTVNRNALPFDPNGPWYTSGVRVGTPALTTLGMGRAEMGQIAALIARVLKASSPDAGSNGEASKAKVSVEPAALSYAQGGVAELLGRFPLYPTLPISS